MDVLYQVKKQMVGEDITVDVYSWTRFLEILALFFRPIWAPSIPTCLPTWHFLGHSQNGAPLTSAYQVDVRSETGLIPHSPGSAGRVNSHLHRRL